MINLRAVLCRASAFLAAVLLLGCGGAGLVEVRGRVLLDGAPLASGLIGFRPIEGTTGPTAGAEIKDGAYQVPNGLAPGTYAVEIRSWQKTGKQVMGPVGKTDEKVNILPQRYWGEATKLRARLEPGMSSVDFELNKKL
jgi:hypothetical protein